MPHRVAKELPGSRGLQSVLDRGLAKGLALTGTALGNVQLMDWRTGHLTIAAQHGFQEDFLRVFRVVTAEDGSACGRAIKRRAPVCIEDVLCDRAFEPFQDTALIAGFRAVTSTPLISSRGAFLGMLSTHFSARHRASMQELRAMESLAETLANEIIRHRAGGVDHGTRRRISFDAVRSSYALLRKSPRG